jgi:hypothetical protein
MYFDICPIKSSNTICKESTIFRVVCNLRGERGVRRRELDNGFIKHKKS